MSAKREGLDPSRGICSMTKGSNRRQRRAQVSHVVEMARRSARAGKYADAIEAFSEAVRLAPHDAVLLNDLGLAFLNAGNTGLGLVWLRRSIAADPHAAYAHFNLGLALQSAGDNDAAIHAHRHAVRLSPDFAVAHGQLADLLWSKGARDEAVVEYERAAASAPNTARGSRWRAKALGGRGRVQDAEIELRQLLARDASDDKAHFMLGTILQEVGRFDEAAASFERSIAIAPAEAAPYYGLVLSRRFTETDRPWIARILARLEAPNVARFQRMALHFAAGKALDDLADYAEAFKHFDVANSIRRGIGSPFDRAELQRVTNRLLARFTPDALVRQAASRDDDQTPVLTREAVDRVLGPRVGRRVPVPTEQSGRCEDGEQLASASAHLQKLGRTLASLRAMDRRVTGTAVEHSALRSPPRSRINACRAGRRRAA
jgi:tetratricopeptide (TPR) repeat protein